MKLPITEVELATERCIILRESLDLGVAKIATYRQVTRSSFVRMYTIMLIKSEHVMCKSRIQR